MEIIVLEPELSHKDAKRKWLNKELYGFKPKYTPTVSTYYRLPQGASKILYLKDALDSGIYESAYKYVNAPQMYSPASASRRACLKGSPGGECFMGWSDNLLYLPSLKRKQTHPQLTAPSVHHWQNYRGMWPMVQNMEDVLRENLKNYWVDRELDDNYGPMVRGEGERSDFFKYPEKFRKQIESWEDWNFFYSIPGSNFTTITLNHNTRFKAHVDPKNSEGALSCLACWGNFRGGELCFPRLDVAVAVGERDMLVCDCPTELHGTLSPPQGTRYSMVAYARHGLTKAGSKAKAAKGGM